MSDPLNDDTQRIAFPFRVLPSQWVDSARAVLAVFVGGVALMVGMTSILLGLPWGVSLFFVGICSAILIGARFAIREAFGRHAPTLGITREHLVFGRRRIPWQQITAPDIEVFEPEGGGHLSYRVTFCIIGDRQFGTWPHLDPARYVSASGVPDSHRVEVLCGFLRQMRASAIANRLNEGVAVPSSLNVVTGS